MREKLIRKSPLLLCVLMVMLAISSFMLLVVGEDMVNEASLKVHIVDLADVGNRWVSNRSKVVEGATQASEINEITVFLAYKGISEIDYMEVNVSVAVNVVSDWNMYKNLVESSSNVIILNTHDEYLPVPSGYSKEEWVGKIADFMMNRWGTWVHAGGYPFNLTWHENGLVEVWGEDGFKTLMSYVGKGDMTCTPPANENERADFSLQAGQHLGPNWYFELDDKAYSIAGIDQANIARPLKYEDIKDLTNDLSLGLFEYSCNGGLYFPAIAIPFAAENETFNFGIYVHFSPWRFYDASDNRLWFDDLAIGYIPIAAAIWSEGGLATCGLYAASQTIQMAQREGRTSGLGKAEALLQEATSAYDSGNFKIAVAYAQQAKEAAENASTPPNYTATAILILMVAGGVGGAAGGYYLFNNRKGRKNEEN